MSRYVDSAEVADVAVVMVSASLAAGHSAPEAVRGALAAIRADLLSDLDEVLVEAHRAAVAVVSGRVAS